MRLLLAAALALSACSSSFEDVHDPAAPKTDARLPELRDAYAQHLAEADALRDPESGWLVYKGCDAALFAGKYAAVTGAAPMSWDFAEYPTQLGRFSRRPLSRPCWSEEAGDTGSKTTWSRDMAKGLIAAAWRTGDRALLERHASFGASNNWKMGEPAADGRVFYSPALIGQVHETIYAMGGANSFARRWPDLYPSGLVDYQAHLQMLNIWQRGEVDQALRRGVEPAGWKPEEGQAPIVDDAADDHDLSLAERVRLELTPVTDQMLDRAREHAAREPANYFYAAVEALYSGDFGATIGLLLDPATPAPAYARCDGEERACALAEWLFAADIVLRRFP